MTFLNISLPFENVTHIVSPHIGLLPNIIVFGLCMRTEEEAQICATFGKHLAQLRKGMGWSQEKLALESGIARSYIGDVERGLRNIALVNICRIANTLMIEPAELMRFREAASE